MTDWSTARYAGPGAKECEERRKQALDVQAERAASQEQRIRRFIDGEGGDPESGEGISVARPAADAPKPARTKDPTEILGKIKAAKDKLAKLKRRKK